MIIEYPERLLERFAFIETELLWGDGLTARQLAETFRITRQAAQKIINIYRKRFPGQMYYVSEKKRHQATESFEPIFIRSSPIAFLDHLRGQTLIGLYREEQDWSDLVVTDVDRLLRQELQLQPAKIVLSALRRQKAVMVDYRKKDLEPGSFSNRVISPNHLVFTDGRYHVRAYCHLKKSYLDFVISRIVDAKPAAEEWTSSNYDRDWNEFVEYRLKPNSSLPISVQTAILRDFGKDNSGVRLIKCRKALFYYINRQILLADPRYGMPLWCIE